MKTKPTNRKVNSSGIQNTVSFGIKEGGFAHIFNVLRNQLYSNKYQAVLREYSTNAVDAHIEAGIPERPIEVSLPTTLEHNLKIRDFGPALTEKEVHEIYAFYGESTKRNTNSQTGMLGIGSKSAFAYGDNFVINSYVDGKKHTYNAFIDPSQVGQIAKLSEEESDEESGIEIVIPVNEKDINVFSDTAKDIFQYFKVRPIIKNQSIEFNDRKTLFEGEGWKWQANDQGNSYYTRNGIGEAVAVMGNIGYPIDFDSLNYEGEDFCDLQTLCHDNLILDIEIGELEISASREQLQYTDNTKETIIEKLKNVRDEIISIIKADFDNCETMFEAKCLFGTINGFESGLYQFRELINKNIQVNGVDVTNDNYWFGKCESDEVTVRTFKKAQRSGKLKLEFVQSIECKDSTEIIYNDVKASRGLMNRLLGLAIEDGKKVYLVTYEDDKVKAKIEKELSLDAPQKKFSELPSRKLNEFEGYGRFGAVQGDWKKDSKHSSKVFSLNWKECKSWRDKQSDYWNKESVDFDNEEGVYVLIERFKPVTERYVLNEVRKWSHIANQLNRLDIEMPKVIGVKIGNRKDVENKDGWVDFETWLTDVLKESSKKFDQKLADDLAAREAIKENWCFSPHNENHDKLRNLLVHEEGEMAKAYDAVKEMIMSEEDAKAIHEVANLANDLQVSLVDHLEPKFNIADMIEKVNAKYEMMGMLDYRHFHWELSDKTIEKLANYVNVIDVCNAKN